MIYATNDQQQQVAHDASIVLRALESAMQDVVVRVSRGEFTKEEGQAHIDRLHAEYEAGQVHTSI